MTTKFFLLLLSILTGVSAVHADRLKVVATLPAFAAIAKQIGGDFAEVSSIASPRFNPHFIEPKPTDVLKVKRADLLIHGGLDLELWRGPLVDAAGNTAVRAGGDRELVLSAGVKLVEVRSGSFSRAEGDIHVFGNPHYWLSPENGRVIARTIAEKLSAIDAKNASAYAENLRTFDSALSEKISGWKGSPLPREKELIGYHNEWVYLTDFLGLRMKHFLEPKPGIPPTPGQLSSLRTLVDSGKAAAVVRASFNPEDAVKSLTSGSDVPVLTLCQQVAELDPCSDYIAMLDYNIQKLREALVR